MFNFVINQFIIVFKLRATRATLLYRYYNFKDITIVNTHERETAIDQAGMSLCESHVTSELGRDH